MYRITENAFFAKFKAHILSPYLPFFLNNQCAMCVYHNVEEITKTIQYLPTLWIEHE
jgi:hypothetical protein